MAIIRDSRADCFRDMVASFVTIQTHQGQLSYVAPGQAGSQFFGQKLGVARRWFYGPHPLSKKGVWWAVEPKVSLSAPRTEAAYAYESATVTRFFMWSFVIPSSGTLAWTNDPVSYTVVGQWHEQYQPNEGREPPFEVDVSSDSSGVHLRLTISEDGGTGTSGNKTYEATHHVFELGDLEKDREYLIAVRCKAEGMANDFLTMWLDGKQVVNYSGYVGYPYYDGSGNWPNYVPNQGTYKQQNFFKIGTYTYFSAASPSYRAIAQRGAIIGDQNETYDSMYAYYMSTPTTLSHTKPRIAVSVLGGTNVVGGGTSGAINRAIAGIPCQDPVAPSTNAQASVVPAISNRLSERGYGVNIANCGVAGAGMTTFVGRCRGTYNTSTVYLAGDTVTPSSLVGNDSTYMPLGLKFVCEVGGTSGASIPTWPTLENATVTDNGITWRAERRESYDVANHTYTFGELGFDPLGLLSQAIAYVDQIAGVDIKLLILAPNLDTAQNTSIAEAVAEIQKLADKMDIRVIVSSQTATGTPDDAQMGNIGRAIADEI